jgi:hypothetical protein
VVAYDADAVTKDLVRIARSELAAHLRGRGALVGFLGWDVTRGKGIDDHLALVLCVCLVLKPGNEIVGIADDNDGREPTADLDSGLLIVHHPAPQSHSFGTPLRRRRTRPPG